MQFGTGEIVTKTPPTKSSRAFGLGAGTSDRLLDGVLDVFGLIAGVDGSVSEREIALVRSYLESLHPPENAGELLELFEDKARTGLDSTRTIASLRERYAYEDAVFLLWKAFELLRSDEILPAELEMARAIGHGLGLRPADLQFVESCSLNGDATTLRPDLGWAMWRLRISDQEAADCVRLPLEGLLVEVFAVGQRYYFRQLDTKNAVCLGGRNFPPNFLTRFRIDQSLTIGRFEFRHVDMTFYFRQLARNAQAKSLYVQAEGMSVGVYEQANPEAALRIDLHGLSITATTLKNQPLVTLNERPLNAATAALPGDSILIGGTPVDLRRLLIHYVTDRFQFNGGALQCRISNGLDADLHVIDDSLVRWTSAVLQEEGALRLEHGDCPHRVLYCGGPLNDRTVVSPGGELRVGPQRIAIEQEFPSGAPCLRCLPPGVERFSADNISHQFRDQSVGLDGISFEARRGELICILGPSGCGKSTLLSVLTGLLIPDLGDVWIDNARLRDNAHLQYRIGYVPQDDLLFENLTVFENLYFGARLRSPALSDRAVRAKVERVFRETALHERRHVRVGSPLDKKLSGGERKRLNIGLELAGENDILLLDEPISGLSSHDAERVVELLRHRTLRGDIIMVVAHQPSARLLGMFDKLLMLDKGGRLAFFGGIERAFSYFDIASPPGDGMSSLQTRVGDPGLLFDVLEQARPCIDGTPDEEREHTPAYWQNKFRTYRDANFPSLPRSTSGLSDESTPAWEPRRLVQFWAGFRREVTNKIRNSANLLVGFATAAALALFVGWACRALEHSPAAYGTPKYDLDNNPAVANFLFLSVIVAQFLGLAGSIQEIVRDRAILLREQMLKIPRTFYLVGKFCTSMLMLSVQLLLYVVLAFWVIQIRELYFAYWILLCFVGAVGIAVGLAVSALPRITDKMASNVIPLLLVPQIVLAGADPFPFERMAHLTWSSEARKAIREDHRPPAIAQLMPSRWGYEALLCLQRDFAPHLRDARDYHEAASAIEVLASRKDVAINATRHLQLYGSDARDPRGKSRAEWQQMRQDAQNKHGNERAEEFFHRSEGIIAFKKLPVWGLVSAVYYNCGVLVLLTAVLMAIALALLRYGRHLDDLSNSLLELLRRASRMIGAWSHRAVPSRRFS